MSDRSAIEWTDATWNPVRAKNRKTGAIGWHCEHVSEGCRNCYAETWNRRLGTGLDYKPGHMPAISVFLDPVALEKPLHWKRPRKIFVCSMTDLFAGFVKDEWLLRIFHVMARCPHHIFQVLTKRPERMRDQVLGIWGTPPPHVWFGVSVEDQMTANVRIPLLLATPASKRFLSCEPVLKEIDLERGGWSFLGRIKGPQGRRYEKIDWVIAGGESGPGARPMHPDWVRNLRDQCAARGVPFFFKQWGEWFPGELEDNGSKIVARPDVDHDANADTWEFRHCDFHTFPAPDFTGMLCVGKKRAGRLLDGVEHNGFPI